MEEDSGPRHWCTDLISKGDKVCRLENGRFGGAECVMEGDPSVLITFRLGSEDPNDMAN